MYSLPEEIVVSIGNKLPDKDLLALSAISKEHNALIRKFFKEYYVVLTDSLDLILLIEKSHPKFNKIIKSTKKQSLCSYRFMTSYNNIWYTNFRYQLLRRSEPGDPTSWSFDELKIWRDKKTVAKDNITRMYSDIEIAKTTLINDVQTKIIDVLNSNNILLFDATEDDDNNPKTEKELLDNVEKDLSDKFRTGWSYGCGYTHFSIKMLQLDTSNQIYLNMKGHWKELLGKTINNKTMKKMLKNSVTYAIHDNGGRPFKVIHKKNTVHILKIHDNDCDREYNIPVMKYNNVVKVFPGIDLTSKKIMGNSVLVNLYDNRYVYIGSGIYEFTVPTGDTIKKYYSQVGNNDVPYPIAVGKTNIYFMLDNVYIPKTMFNGFSDWYNAYSYFYGHTSPTREQMKGLNFLEYEDIHERIW